MRPAPRRRGASLRAMVIAHAGHWTVGLLYLAPAVLVYGGLWLRQRRDQRNH